MKVGMSAWFHAAAWVANKSTIALLSASLAAGDWAEVARAGEINNNASKSLLIGFPPRSAYNDGMSAVTASSPFRVVHTVCSHDCPDSCAVLVTVDGRGRAIKVAGDPTHPVTQGFL